MAPESEEEEMAFDELEDVLGDHEMSAAVGWAIQQRSMLLCKYQVREMRGLLRGSFDGRLAQNWAFLLLCAKQVRLYTYYCMPQYTFVCPFSCS